MSFEDADLVAAFVVESLEHLADIENQLLSIEGAGEALDVELVNTVFRAVHSVKGAAGFLGLQAINRLAHSLENVLNLVRNRELIPTSMTVDVMLKAADSLRQLLEDVETSNTVDVSEHTTKLDAIVTADGPSAPAPAPVQKPKAQAPVAVPNPSPSPAAKPTPVATHAQETAMESSDADEPAPHAHVTHETRNESSTSSNTRKSDSTPELNIRVPVTVLDRLMNLAGELVLGRNQLLQAIGSADQAALESAAAGMDQVTSELQEAIMQTRMQPIGNVFGKFPRIVRDLSAKLGKQCDLQIEGREVEVDKSIIEAISDPLTHLIRNSVDHGLEPPAVRSASGKRPMGTVVLRAFHQAGKVRIDIQDDGAGINPSVIREKAQQKGLITAEQAATMSDRETLRLIFAPGFSTAAVVTDVSGRGVGMDVVRTNIEKLGGSVDIDSTIGRGTTIKITLPLTLAIIPSLVVQGGEHRYALPQVNIVELVRVRAEEVGRRVSHIKGSDVLRLRGSLLPLVHLSDALGLPHRSKTSARPLHVVVVEAGQVRYGLVVDEMHDSEEIVVKPLGRHLKQCHYIAGATILGDGEVALILDVAGISAGANLRMEEGRDNSHETMLEADASDNLQTLLLFRNHPSEQFAIPMGLVSRIERVRADQIDSVGGQELLQFRGASLTLLRVDQVIKARPCELDERLYVVVFDLRGREIGLVVPLLDDIRRITGKIDVMTFNEKGVAGSMVIDGHATRILDLYELSRLAHPEWFVEQENPKSPSRPKSVAVKLLLAEDSKFFQRQVVGFLENAGYEVVAAEDGQHALDLLEDGLEVQLIITDIEMPRMDGLEFCRRVRSDARWREMPVIALTSLAGTEDIRRGYEVGVTDYQVKMDRERLIASVSDQLAARGIKVTKGATT